MKSLYSIIISAIILINALPIHAQQSLYVLTDGAGITRQSLLPFTSDNKVDPNLIRAAWNADNHIVSAGYTVHGLQISIASHPTWGNQTYTLTDSIPSDFISNVMDKGYMITELASNGSQWLVVATTDTQYKYQQLYCFTTPKTDDEMKLIKDSFAALAEYEFYITDCTYCKATDTWTVVASNSGFPMSQVWDFLFSPNDVINFFNTHQGEGYRFSAIDYGNGRYLTVMTRHSQYALGQTISINYPNPNALFSNYWNKGYIITQIGH